MTILVSSVFGYRGLRACLGNSKVLQVRSSFAREAATSLLGLSNNVCQHLPGSCDKGASDLDLSHGPLTGQLLRPGIGILRGLGLPTPRLLSSQGVALNFKVDGTFFASQLPSNSGTEILFNAVSVSRKHFRWYQIFGLDILRLHKTTKLEGKSGQRTKSQTPTS